MTASSINGANTGIPITVDNNIQHGTVELSATSGTEGQTITVTPKPNAGYKIKEKSLMYSIDNGLTWKIIENNNFALPQELAITTGYFTGSVEADWEYVKDWQGNGKGTSVAPLDVTHSECDAVDVERYNYTSVYISPKSEIKGNSMIIDANAQRGKYYYKIFFTDGTYKNGQAQNGKTSIDFGALKTISKVNLSDHYYSYSCDGGTGILTNDITVKDTISISVVITAEFEPIEVNYKVNHYVENSDGSYSLIESETKSALTDSTVNSNTHVKQIEGFTLNKATN